MDHVTVYTDGSCIYNEDGEHAGGFAYIILNGQKTTFAENIPCASSYDMELKAIVEALKAVEQPATVTLYSDAMGLLNILRRGGYKKRAKPSKKGPPNPLFVELYNLLESSIGSLKVEFVHISDVSDDLLLTTHYLAKGAALDSLPQRNPNAKRELQRIQTKLQRLNK